MKTPFQSDEETKFEAFKRNIDLWHALRDGRQDADEIITGDRIDTDRILTNLLAVASEYLEGTNNADLLSVNTEFLLLFLAADPKRITKLFENCSLQVHKSFMDDLITCLDSLRAGHLIRAVMVIDHIIYSTSLDRNSKVELIQPWIFALLGIITQHNPRPTEADQEEFQIKRAMLYALGLHGYMHLQPRNNQIADEQQDFTQYINDRHQAIIYLICAVTHYLQFTGEVNLVDAEGNGLLHYLAQVKFVHPEIQQLLTFLIENNAECNLPNGQGSRPIQLVLRNKYNTDALEVIASKLSAQDLEELLYLEAVKEQVNTSVIFALLGQLAKDPVWTNYELRIHNELLWKRQFFVDLNLIKKIAGFVYACQGPLPQVLKEIHATYGNATLQIASCIAYCPDNPSSNVLHFLATNPQICSQLNTRAHFSMLESILLPRKWRKDAVPNIVALCFANSEDPIATAKEHNNLSLLLLIYRLTYNRLSSTNATILRDAMLEMIEKKVPTVELSQYIQHDSGCCGYFVSSNNAILLKAMAKQESSKLRPIIV